MVSRCALIRHALIFVGIVLLFLAIWATVDRWKLNPIYRPLLCANPSAAIPVDLERATAEGVSGTLVVRMQCTNPNLYGASVEGSAGEVLSPNLASPSSPPVRVGRVTYTGMELAPSRHGVNQVSFSVTLAPKLVQSSLDYMSVHEQTMPMYSVIDAEVDAKAQFMRVPTQLRNVLPRKYCGAYLRLARPPLEGKNASLAISSPTICRNSLRDMEAAMAKLNATGGTAGYIDSLDPAPEALDGLRWQIGARSAGMMAAGYGFGGALLAVALCLRCLCLSASEREDPGVAGGLAEEAGLPRDGQRCKARGPDPQGAPRASEGPGEVSRLKQ